MWIDMIGWIGSAMIVGAYAFNTYGKIRSDSHIYHWLNIIGSICLVINTYYHNAIPSTVVNAIWIVIALLGLLRIRRVRKKR